MKVQVIRNGKSEVGTATKTPAGGWQVKRADGYTASGDTLEEATDNAGK